MTKNLKIKNTLMETRIRRASMGIKVFEVKVDESHVSKKKKDLINKSFLEAKWIYNHLIGSENIFEVSKVSDVDVLVFNKDTQKCDIVENRKIQTLGSQIRQSIIKRVQQNIINLGKAKKSGIKVGKLKFAKEVNSLPLKQFGTTFKIKNNKYIFVQNIGKLRVSGLDQILSLKNYEIACATLVRKPNGIYIKITIYVDKVKIDRNGEIGLDFGIGDNIVDSNGNKFNWSFKESEKLKREQKRLSKKKKGNKNRKNQILKIRKLHQKLTNKKENAANQFVSTLKKYEKVVIQDENLRGWQSGFFGKQIQHSILGRIKSKIQNLETSIVINRWIPTTKICPSCLKINNIKLNQRIYVCECGFEEDRDIKSAKTILCFKDYTPTEHRSLPVEELTNFFKKYVFKDKLYPMNQEAAKL